LEQDINHLILLVSPVQEKVGWLSWSTSMIFLMGSFS